MSFIHCGRDYSATDVILYSRKQRWFHWKVDDRAPYSSGDAPFPDSVLPELAPPSPANENRLSLTNWVVVVSQTPHIALE